MFGRTMIPPGLADRLVIGAMMTVGETIAVMGKLCSHCQEHPALAQVRYFLEDDIPSMPTLYEAALIRQRSGVFTIVDESTLCVVCILKQLAYWDASAVEPVEAIFREVDPVPLLISWVLLREDRIDGQFFGSTSIFDVLHGPADLLAEIRRTLT